MPKWISVEKAFSKQLEEAVEFVKRNESDMAKGAVGGAASGIASAAAKYLLDKGIPHKTGDDKKHIPANHVYHSK